MRGRHGWLVTLLLLAVAGGAGAYDLDPAQWRRDGRAVEAELLELLQPGDLFLVKLKGDLFDKLIPGYFAHAGVWLGRYEELVDLGAFGIGTNQRSWRQARACRDQLAEGRTLLEAHPVGIICSPLETTLTYHDTVAVLRLKRTAGLEPGARKAEQAGIVGRALYHACQPYDFSFDVNTSDVVVCSELLYSCYPPDVTWATAKR